MLAHAPTAHWAAAYIGLPYAAEPAPPASFHCWALVRWVSGRHYARPLPAIPCPSLLRDQLRALRAEAEGGDWQKHDRPADGDLVLMRSSRHPSHVGIWVATLDGGGVLHCLGGIGVVFQRVLDLRASGMTVEGYYRYGGPAPADNEAAP